ncbi:MAG: bacillithiol biosynthesis cysteine-adding enzyme BshC [Bacteroidia bacterium]|nr:bacillithiol biosynthesis cysteine-adding enzyme BshC [Bacteroidia bacterium]
MFQKHTLSFEDTGLLNALVQDYLLKKKDTEQLYVSFPDIDGYKKILGDTKLYATLDRKILVQSLLQQAQAVTNTSKESLANISQLGNTNCFTVTTGHQLCLFTGPLYFIYKIISTINLSEWLNKSFPDKKFVPVYWMASEDHDFEEVNHAFAYGKKIEWKSDEKGAVGNFKTKSIELAISELETVLGPGENSKELISLFKNAYLNHDSLDKGTRFLVNELFGQYGLVIADGNDKTLKQELKALIKKDIFENIPAKKANETIAYLQTKKYSVQVNPRDVNCFYLDENGRHRIEKTGDSYSLIGTNKVFSKTELEKLIDVSPEKISPNVVLRPMYQQHILPNIAYVGGPGELNYWLEYKTMFETLGVFFPILQLRASIMIIDKNQDQKLNKLGIANADIFKSEQELVNFIVESKGESIELGEEKKKAEAIFNDLQKKTTEIDKTLENLVKAELQKTLNSMNAIEAKLNKSLKQRSETEINQIKNIRSKLFPDNIPQERYDNFSMYHAKYGKGFIAEIKKQTEGNELKYFILKEV